MRNAIWACLCNVRFELSLLPACEHRALWREVRDQIDARNYSWWVPLLPFLMLPVFFVIWYFLWHFTLTPWLALGFWLVMEVANIVKIRMLRRVVQREMRKALVRRGIVVCVNCGYDLRGARESDRCPECGATPMPVTVGRDES